MSVYILHQNKYLYVLGNVIWKTETRTPLQPTTSIVYLDITQQKQHECNAFYTHRNNLYHKTTKAYAPAHTPTLHTQR